MEKIILEAEDESWLYREVQDLFKRARDAGLSCRILNSVINLIEKDSLKVSYLVEIEIT
jgi:uncharacterized protein (UPF0335 family)